MQTPIETKDLTATLLRRIALAVDGIRQDGLVWVVFDERSPYEVALVTPSRQKAEDVAAGKGLSFAGPFKAMANVTTDPRDPRFIVLGHQPDSDWGPWGEITDQTFNPQVSLQKSTDVEEIQLRWKAVGQTDYDPGNAVTFRWDSNGTDQVYPMVDALFLSQAAADKFLYPYIAVQQSARTAFEQRARLHGELRKHHVGRVTLTGPGAKGQAVLVDGSGTVIYQ